MSDKCHMSWYIEELLHATAKAMVAHNPNNNKQSQSPAPFAKTFPTSSSLSVPVSRSHCRLCPQIYDIEAKAFAQEYLDPTCVQRVCAVPLIFP